MGWFVDKCEPTAEVADEAEPEAVLQNQSA
jgi:NhaC family Na+:H+ antiporter